MHRLVETKIKKPVQDKVKYGKVIDPDIYSDYTVTIFILNVELIEPNKILKYSKSAPIWAAMSKKPTEIIYPTIHNWSQSYYYN